MIIKNSKRGNGPPHLLDLLTLAFSKSIYSNMIKFHNIKFRMDAVDELDIRMEQSCLFDCY